MVNNCIYTINRETKVSKHEKLDSKYQLLKNNIDISQGKTQSSFDQLVTDSICSYDDLVNLFIIMQKNNNSFTQMTGKERKSFILKLIKLDIFEQILKETQHRKLALISNISFMNKLLLKEKYMNKIKDDSLTNLQKMLNQNNKRMEEIELLLRDLSIQQKQQEDEYANLNKIIIKQEYDISSINWIDNIEDKIIELEKKIKSKNNNMNLQEVIMQKENLQEELKIITETLKNYANIHLDKIQFDLNYKNKINKLNDDINNLVHALGNLKVFDQKNKEIK
jgi:DNA repair exonuclease SbcCD ATPase subunit